MIDPFFFLFSFLFTPQNRATFDFIDAERFGLARFGSASLSAIERQPRDPGDIDYLSFGQY
jgi:hypothetical protein